MLMIFQFLSSGVTVLFATYLITILAGGPLSLFFEPVLAVILILCTAVMLVLSGSIKDFGFVFQRKKKIEAASLGKLKNAKSAVDLAIYTLLFCSLFISFAAFILYFFNSDNLLYAGLNLSAVLLSLLYAFIFILILSPVSARVERQTIFVMAEDRETKTGTDTKLPIKQICVIAGTYVLLLAFFVAAFLFVRQVSMRNSKEIPAPFDIPTFLGILLYVLFALLCAGEIKDLGKAFAVTLGIRKLGPGEQFNMIVAVNLTLRTLLLAAGTMTIIGGITILGNLTDKNALQLNVYFDFLGVLYALLFCLLLLPVKAVITRWKET